MSKKHIQIKEVETAAGLRYRAIAVNDDGKELILRDSYGAGIFTTKEEVEFLGDFWSERKEWPFQKPEEVENV